MKQRGGWVGGSPGCGKPMRATGGRVNPAGRPAYADGGEVEGEAPPPRLDRAPRVSVKIGAAPPMMPVPAGPMAAPPPPAQPGPQVIPPMGGMPMSPDEQMQRPMASGGRVKGGAGGGLYRMAMQNKR